MIIKVVEKENFEVDVVIWFRGLRPTEKLRLLGVFIHFYHVETRKLRQRK